MKNLVLSSLICLLVIACHFGHYKQLKPAPENTVIPLIPFFKNNLNLVLFKTNITIYNKNISGLMAMKQLQPNDFRLIFTTELGMKLFDFEFNDTTFIMHYCVPQFNRPKLLETIKKDIEILLMNNIKGKQAVHLIDKEGVYSIDKLEFDGRYNYYFIDNKSKNLVKIEHSKGQKKLITFALNNYQNSFPNNIVIEHYNIKLKIELNVLKQ